MSIIEKHDKTRYYIYKIALSFLFSCMFVTLITFYAAYASPAKTLTIVVDGLHEAHIEFILILIIVPLTFFLFYDMQKNILPKIKKGEL